MNAPVAMAFGHYFIMMAILFVVVGMIGYVVDRKFGVVAYKWFYDLFHKEPLNSPVGFIYEQVAKQRLWASVFLSVATVLLVGTTAGVIGKIFMAVLGVIILMISYYLGPLAVALIGKINMVADVFQEYDKGKSPTQAIKDVFGLPGSEKAKSDSTKDEPIASGKESEGSGSTAPVAETVIEEKPKEPTPEEVIDRFTKEG